MCSDCRIDNLERKKRQFDDLPGGKPLHQRPAYPSRSKKVWRDRFEAARKDLRQALGRYAEGIRTGRRDSWWHERFDRQAWLVTRYRRARADAKAHGAI